MTSALPFISVNKDQFVIHDSAVKLLNSIKTPVCPIVVCGPYRTGKSTLLNMLVTQNKYHSFQVGGSIQACTKGIWLYGAPITQNGVTYLFLDSEGLGALTSHSSATFDVSIFTLSVLLASLFVLNTQGTINENAIQQLELVVEMTKQIAIKEHKGGKGQEKKEEDMGDLAQHFPAFLWVLRDFVLQLEGPDGQPLTARAYLESALQQQPVTGPEKYKQSIIEKNRIRSAISQVFLQRDCVPLVRPVADERQLQKMHEIGEKDMRPEFRQQIADLREKMYRMAPPKLMQGHPVTGPMFLSLAREYIKAINEGAVPTIQSAWQSVVALQSREALDTALTIYRQSFASTFSSEHIVLDEDEMTQLLLKTELDALTALREKAVGDISMIRALETEMKKQVAPMIADQISINKLRSQTAARNMIESLWDQSGLESKLASYTSSREWNTDREKLLTEYRKKAKGPAKEEVARTFLDSKHNAAISSAFTRLEAEHKRATSLQSQLENEQKALATEKARAQEQHQAATLKQQQQQQHITSLEKELAKAEAKIASLEKEIASLREQQRDHEKSWRDMEHKLRDDIRDATSATKSIQSQHDSLIKQHGIEKSHLEKEMNSLRSQLTRTEEALANAKSSHEKEQNSQQTLLFQAKRKQEELEETIRTLEESVSTLTDEKIAWTRQQKQQSSDLDAERTSLTQQITDLKTEVRDARRTAKDERQTWEQKMLEKEQQLQRARDEVKTITDKIRDMEKSTSSTTSTWTKRAHDAEEERDALQKRVRELEKQMEQQEKQRAKEEKAEVKEKEKEIKDKEKEVKEKEKEIKEKEKEIKTLQKEIKDKEKEWESERSSLLSRASSASSSSSELTTLRARITELEREQSESDEEHVRVLQERKSALARIAELEKELRVSRSSQGSESSQPGAESDIRGRKRGREELDEKMHDVVGDEENFPPVQQPVDDLDPTVKRAMRLSLAPQVDVSDVEKWTIQKIKSRLTELDVEFDQTTKPKQAWLDLLYQYEPALANAKPPAPAAAKRKSRR